MPITYTKYGNFRLTFYTFMICDGDDVSCSDNKDLFTVSVDSTDDIEMTFDLNYYQDTKGWKKTTIDFEIQPYDKTYIVSLLDDIVKIYSL